MKLKLKKFTTGINVGFFKAEAEFEAPETSELNRLEVQEGDLIDTTIDITREPKVIKMVTVSEESDKIYLPDPDSDPSSGSLDIQKKLKEEQSKRESLSDDLINRIKKCQRGGTKNTRQRNADKWEKLCEEAIRLVFSNDFSSLVVSRHASAKWYKFKKNIRDIVISVNPKTSSKSTFWYDLKREGTKLIVFECKNYRKASTEAHISQLHRYLSLRGGRDFGILLTRVEADKSAYEAIHRYKEDKYRILIFDQAKIITLLDSFAKYGMVEDFFDKEIQKFSFL